MHCRQFYTRNSLDKALIVERYLELFHINTVIYIQYFSSDPSQLNCVNLKKYG